MKDLVTWIAIAVAFTFGVVAYLQSRSANKIAKDARELAESSKQLGTDANELSRESNRIAVDARQFAEEANTIAGRAELRETEVNDVRWVGEWKEPGTYRLTNRGEHEAHRVRATVTVDGEEAHQTAELVPSGDSFLLEIPGARAQFLRERDEIVRWEQATRRAESSSDPLRMAVPPPYPISLPNNIFERVAWVTPLGKECIHDKKSPVRDLGE